MEGEIYLNLYADSIGWEAIDHDSQKVDLMALFGQQWTTCEIVATTDAVEIGDRPGAKRVRTTLTIKPTVTP